MYNRFLIKYNGGYTPKTTFRLNGISSDIKGFYGLGNINDFYNLLGSYLSDKIEFFAEKDYLPIAVDSFGNDILLGIDNETYGNIFFYDQELQNFTIICDNFETLIKKINSKKFVVRTIEERIEGLREVNSPLIIDDELLNLWQQEIDKYGNEKQEIVKL